MISYDMSRLDFESLDLALGNRSEACWIKLAAGAMLRFEWSSWASLVPSLIPFPREHSKCTGFKSICAS